MPAVKPVSVIVEFVVALALIQVEFVLILYWYLIPVILDPLSSRRFEIETRTAFPAVKGVTIKDGVFGAAGATAAVIGVADATAEFEEVPIKFVADARN